MRNLLITFCLFLSFTNPGLATSYYFPKFGTPIVAGEVLVFSGPGMHSPRLICVAKRDGKKIWDIKSTTNMLAPWFMLNDSLVVTAGPDVNRCDLSSGRMTRLCSSGYDKCGLAKLEEGKILLSGDKKDVDYLSCVDPTTWQKVWEVPRAIHVSAQGNEVILCDTGKRKRVGGGGYTYQDRGLAGISRKEGKVLWRYPLSGNIWGSKAVAASNYFVVALGGTVHCFNQADGKIVKSLKVNDSDLVSPTLAVHNGEVLMWARKGTDVFSGHIVSSLNVPDLEKKELTETDWYSAVSYAFEDVLIGVTIGRVDAYHVPTKKKLWQGGQWNWDGVHDGFIYFSDLETDAEHTSINRIQVKTGERTKLYEELLPPEMRPKK